jgi:hypothetical protein
MSESATKLEFFPVAAKRLAAGSNPTAEMDWIKVRRFMAASYQIRDNSPNQQMTSKCR